MFKEKPKNIDGDIIDFIGDDANEYLKDFDVLAKDKKGNITIETEILQNLCEILIPKNKKIIDVGCGEGYILNNISGKLVGVDSSKLRLLYLNENITKVRANVESLPFYNEYFDIAICTDVFEHVENEKKLSNELYRILKPKGLLLFACPWEQDLSVYDLKEFKEKYKSYKCRHRRSVNDKIINENFVNFKKISETTIISIKRFMKFTPYSIKFIQFIRE